MSFPNLRVWKLKPIPPGPDRNLDSLPEREVQALEKSSYDGGCYLCQAVWVEVLSKAQRSDIEGMAFVVACFNGHQTAIQTWGPHNPKRGPYPFQWLPWKGEGP